MAPHQLVHWSGTTGSGSHQCPSPNHRTHRLEPYSNLLRVLRKSLVRDRQRSRVCVLKHCEHDDARAVPDGRHDQQTRKGK